MILMRGNMHNKGHWKGWALKIETFLGPEMPTSEKLPSDTSQARWNGGRRHGSSIDILYNGIGVYTTSIMLCQYVLPVISFSPPANINLCV